MLSALDGHVRDFALVHFTMKLSQFLLSDCAVEVVAEASMDILTNDNKSAIDNSSNGITMNTWKRPIFESWRVYPARSPTGSPSGAAGARGRAKSQ
jgi:hypothetical protein